LEGQTFLKVKAHKGNAKVPKGWYRFGTHVVCISCRRQW
jgi:hypothetical protein